MGEVERVQNSPAYEPFESTKRPTDLKAKERERKTGDAASRVLSHPAGTRPEEESLATLLENRTKLRSWAECQTITWRGAHNRDASMRGPETSTVQEHLNKLHVLFLGDDQDKACALKELKRLTKEGTPPSEETRIEIDRLLSRHRSIET